MIKHVILLCLFLLLIIGSCKERQDVDLLAHIVDPTVKRVLSKAFDDAGGLDTYRILDKVAFTKKTILYLADGAIESEVVQHQEFDLQPELTGRISWEDSLGSHQIIYTATDQYKTLNNQRVNNSEIAAKSTFFSNYFVLFLPFKLIDPGVTLTYEGTTVIEDKEADIIKAIYSPDIHDNHSTSDEWYLYFDTNTGQVIANLVYHEPTFAFIENTQSTDQYPLRMNLYRQTWRTDGARNKEYLRGEFWYSDYDFSLPGDTTY